MTAPWAVLFDLDGTLVDTEPLLHEALLEVLGASGSPVSAIEPGELRGRSVVENLDWLSSSSNLSGLSSRAPSPLSAQELYSRVSGHILDRLRLGIAPVPGAADLLRALRQAGVPCALVSSSYRAMVDAVLPSLGRAEFAVTLAGDEVRHPKPDPEPYRTAAIRLGIAPQRCVVVEDSPAGLRSGRAAGCVTVSVTPTVAPTEEAVALCVRNLSELTVERLARLVDVDADAAPVRIRQRNERSA